MSFLHPEFLYYMLPPIFILFTLLLTQKESQANYFSPDVMEKLRVSSNRLTLKARNALFMLMAVLMVIALAGPVINDGEVEIKAKSADIILALDISDSMLAQDLYPNRLEVAKKKALDILKEAPNERVGIIAFAKNSYLVSPLSFDHAAVGFLLRQLDTTSITEKGTNFLSMLEVVDQSIKKDSQKYLLILSDGGDSKEFTKEIAYAKEKNITVYVLGIGTQKGAPIKMKSGAFIKKNGEIIVTKLNESIAELATQTGGVYIESVKSKQDINTMLNEIESHSKKKELKSEKIQRFIPLFYYPIGMALVLLLIATSSMSKRESLQIPAVFLIFGLLFLQENAQAGVLDFMELKKAKEAYESGDYQRSQKIYEAYAKKSNNGESYYNAANALYKQKQYDKAIELYQQALFDNKKDRAKNYANLGNAYAKKMDEKSLKSALKAYENSLKLQEDKDTRDNLEAVKKALEKKKQKNKEQKNKEQKKNNKKNKDQQQKDQKNKEQQQKNQDKKQQSDKKGESKKNQKNSSEKDQNQDSHKKQSKENRSDKDGLKKLEDQQEKNKKKSKQEQKKKSTQADPTQNKQEKMSDAEEKKWLNQLNKQQSTYIYMLNKQNKVKEDTNEMPW
jgi:Ca-activated chloride channel family protein